MNNTKQILVSLILIALFSNLALAVTPTLKIVKKDPQTEDKINKLLIIVLLKTKENRVTLENELGYDLGDYGISTKSSHNTRIASSEQLTKEAVIAVCEKHGADGVLVVRLIDSKDENSYSYNERSQYTGAGFTSSNSSGVVIGGGKTYSWGDYAYGNYFDAVSSTKILVQTDIYLVKGAKQLMAEDFSMRIDPREEEKAIGDFAKKLSKKIAKQKFMVKEKK